jgi:hypothetical protein
MGPEAVSNRQKRVTRRNLCLPAPVRTAFNRLADARRGHNRLADARRGHSRTAGRAASRLAIGRTLRLQHRKPDGVHRLEWERALEPRVGCRIELARSPQGLVAFQLGTIALKTDGPRPGGRRPDSPCPSSPVQLAARGTPRSRAFALELPSRERHPFGVGSLRSLRGQLCHTRAVYAVSVTDQVIQVADRRIPCAP